jgi:hypothetical protein
VRGALIAQAAIGDLVLLGFFPKGREERREEARIIGRQDVPPATICQLADEAWPEELSEVLIYHDTGESAGGAWAPVVLLGEPREK